MRYIAAMLLLVLASCKPAWQKEAEQAASHNLNDPASAQFRSVKLCPTGIDVEGEMNAKNLYGAYVGFRPFVYALDRKQVFFLEKPGLDSAVFYLLAKDCWTEAKWRSEVPKGYPEGPGMDRQFWLQLLEAKKRDRTSGGGRAID